MNTPPLRAILMAMQIRRYIVERIAHDNRSRATLGAILHCHWASIRPVLPWRTPWSSILAQKIKLWHCEMAVLKLALERYETDPLLSLSK
jgi:hypothetical protein